MTRDNPEESALRYDRPDELEGEDTLSGIARLIKEGSTVLDLGTATGKLGLFLSQKRGCVVDGAERDAEAAAVARPRYRSLLQLDLETDRLADHFAPGAYDAIVCADVLEHLRDPGRVLDQLHGLLAPAGRLLLSIPNIGYAGVIAGLLQGDFHYRPTGLLDSTHLRFFTRKSLFELLAAHGFGVLSVRPRIIQPDESEFNSTALGQLAPSLLAAVLDAPDSLTYQFLVEAAPGEHAATFAGLLTKPPLRFRVQAFWANPGAQYSEEQSVGAPGEMGVDAQRIELRLPTLSPAVARLRVDLADRPGFLRLAGIRVLSSAGDELWRWDGNEQSLPVRHDLVHFAGPWGPTWLATGSDPYLELPLPASALARASGGAIELSLGFPASSDHVFASAALEEHRQRWETERRALTAHLEELQRDLRASAAAVAAAATAATAREAAERLSAEEKLARQRDEARSGLAALSGDVSALGEKLSAAQDRLGAIAQRLRRLEEAVGLRPLLREIRSNLLRPRLDYTASPALEPRAADAGEATGSAKRFELIPTHGRHPCGWVRLHLELDTALAFVNRPRLEVDEGEGYRDSSSIALPRPLHGRIETHLRLPKTVHGLRLLPLDRAGTVRLGRVWFQEIGHLEARVRSAAPLALEILSEPGRTRKAAGKALAALREGGVRGLQRRLRERTHLAQSYDEWVEKFDTLDANDRAEIEQRIPGLAQQPLFSVLMPVYETPAVWLRRALDSVLEQLYPRWELCVADDASKSPHVRQILQEYAARDARIKLVLRPVNGHISECSNSALALATGEFVVLLDHDDELPRHALYLVAEELSAHPGADVLYSDEDKIDESGRRYDPYFKPDWDPDLLSAQTYLSHLGVYRRSLVQQLGGFRKGLEGSQDHDLALRCSARTQQIRHLPHVLYHWRAVEGSTAASTKAKLYAQTAAERALCDHYALIDPRITVERGAAPSSFRVRRPRPDPAPLVSLIVPPRDSLAILRRCLDSVAAKTLYPHYEILVVDNDSKEEATLAYFEGLRASGRARVIPVPGPFNYSAINNRAVREARGEVLCLLNNDVEVIGPDWLDELVSQALRPEIGAVGAKLLYPNDTIQHAGVITGLYGIAGHVHRDLPRDAPGYFGRAQLIQRLSAVTAACLAVRKQIYLEVGGLDEQHLAVAFNDVDFCLRLLAAGYHNLYTPHAELYHHESASRGSDETSEKRERFARELDYMKRRWGGLLERDPAYNPNLSLHSLHFELAWPPRPPRPWRRDLPSGGK